MATDVATNRVTRYLDLAEQVLRMATDETDTDRQGHLTAIANTYDRLANSARISQA